VYSVVFYQTRGGDAPVQDFLSRLHAKTKIKTLRWLELLEKEGPRLKRPYADYVSDKLYELRIRLASDHIRILYAFFDKQKIVLLHSFRKRDQKLRDMDIRMAKQRYDDFMIRYANKELEFDHEI